MKKKILIISVFIAISFAGCRSLPEDAQTSERIIKHITILEKELSEENNLYNELSLIASSKEMSILNELDYDHGYNKEGRLIENHSFKSDEYRMIPPNIIDKFTDGKLLGRYYSDKDYNIYYFTEPINPYHTEPKKNIAFLEKELLKEDNVFKFLSEIIEPEKMELYNKSDKVQGYDIDGMISNQYQFNSKEYRCLLNKYVENFADVLLLGEYYVDENYNVYYFIGPSHLKP